MKRTKFTLIELLVVMAVIGILAGMLMPVLSSMKTKGKITKAKAEINSIITAVKQYETDYGVLPWTAGTADKAFTDTSGNESSSEYTNLFKLLTGVDPSNGNSLTWNVRNIRYIDTQNGYVNKGFLDPFGMKYRILLDLDYNSQITISPFGTGTPNPYNGSIAIYSFGPNKTTGTNAVDSDDICSWK